MNYASVNDGKQALCFEEYGNDISREKISEFTQDINLKDYLVCKHKSGTFCGYGISYANLIMCNCNKVVNLQRN